MVDFKASEAIHKDIKDMKMSFSYFVCGQEEIINSLHLFKFFSIYTTVKNTLSCAIIVSNEYEKTAMELKKKKKSAIC